jgi:hypothetical protein
MMVYKTRNYWVFGLCPSSRYSGFEFHPYPQLWLYTRYPVQNLWSQSPHFPEQVQMALWGIFVILSSYFFQINPLSKDSPKYFTSINSWIVLLKRINFVLYFILHAEPSTVTSWYHDLCWLPSCYNFECPL